MTQTQTAQTTNMTEKTRRVHALGLASAAMAAIATTPHIRQYLELHDREALAQMERAMEHLRPELSQACIELAQELGEANRKIREAQETAQAQAQVQEAAPAYTPDQIMERLGMGSVEVPMVYIEHEPMDAEQVPLAAFVKANLEDEEAIAALVELIKRHRDTGASGEAVIGGGAVPLAALSLVFVQEDITDLPTDRAMTPGEYSYSLSCCNGSVYRD